MSFITLTKLALFAMFHWNVGLATHVGPHFLELQDQGHIVQLPAYSNREQINPRKVTHVIIFIHGLLRNAQGGYKILMDRIRSTGHLTNTLIIAPQFLTPTD